ncbi:Trk system potassium transporter TrkA [Halosimplex aquaticum]|uniref:Trk system potassium transporter TrkA n=1 Tax=Halosimplex aquaticum TaxID=3026162 RepID=A0ABD5XVV7_9EURY|nr:Trk system potassium transporter TrkA [Halosimplex aquaticum]
MRIVIVGAGEVGSTTAESLCEEHEVVVVDRDSERVESLTYDMDVLPIEGDASEMATLEEAGVGEADLLIASTDDDETNIIACGIAKVCGDVFTIARTKSPKYLRPWERGKRAFGVDFMVCTDLLAAEAIVGVTGLPTAQDVDSFADGLVQMTEFEIPPGSPVADQTVAEADRFDSLTFAGVIRDGEVIIPRGETVLRTGDDVIAIGNPESMREFSAAIAPEQDDPKNVVIVGGGQIGYQTARLLEDGGFSPRLIERNGERARWLAEQLPRTTVINGDPTDQDLLSQENVGDADVLISALETDQQNLLVTLLSSRLGAKRAIAVVETADFVDLFETVGVDVAVSPRNVTAEEITRFTRERRAENVAIIEGDQAEVLELEVEADSILADRSIREAAADFPHGAVIGAIARDGAHINPRGDTIVREGDHVIVFADRDALSEVAERM